MLTVYVMMNDIDDVIGVIRIDDTQMFFQDTKWILRNLTDYRNMVFNKHECRLQNERIKVLASLFEMNGRTANDLAAPLIQYLESSAGIHAYTIQGYHFGLAEYDYECHKWGIER